MPLAGAPITQGQPLAGAAAVCGATPPTSSTMGVARQQGRRAAQRDATANSLSPVRVLRRNRNKPSHKLGRPSAFEMNTRRQPPAFDKFVELIPSGFGIGIRRNGRGGCFGAPRSPPRQCFRSPRINSANARFGLWDAWQAVLSALTWPNVGMRFEVSTLSGPDCPQCQNVQWL